MTKKIYSSQKDSTLVGFTLGRLSRYPQIAADVSNFFMTKRDIALITDPAVSKALLKWKRLSVRLFLIWVITAFAYIIIAAIINQTIGFK